MLKHTQHLLYPGCVNPDHNHPFSSVFIMLLSSRPSFCNPPAQPAWQSRCSVPPPPPPHPEGVHTARGSVPKSCCFEMGSPRHAAPHRSMTHPLCAQAPAPMSCDTTWAAHEPWLEACLCADDQCMLPNHRCCCPDLPVDACLRCLVHSLLLLKLLHQRVRCPATASAVVAANRLPPPPSTHTRPTHTQCKLQPNRGTS